MIYFLSSRFIHDIQLFIGLERVILADSSQRQMGLGRESIKKRKDVVTQPIIGFIQRLPLFCATFIFAKKQVTVFLRTERCENQNFDPHVDAAVDLSESFHLCTYE